MFSVDLDHLNIVVMLILAFFSFRSYHYDRFAIQFQSESQETHIKDQSQYQQKKKQNHSDHDKPQLKSQHNHLQSQNLQHSQLILSSPSIQIEVEKNNISEFSIQHQNDNQFKVQIATSEDLCEKKSDQSSSIETPSSSDKQEKPTISNILQSHQSQLLSQEQEEFLSNQASSINTQSAYCQSDDSHLGLNRKQKKKLIQKARRKMKKSIKKSEKIIENHSEVVKVL